MSRIVGLGAVALVCLGAPILLDELGLRLAILALLTGIAVVGLVFSFGYVGLIHLGQATFAGIGAYASTLLATRAGLPVGLSIVCAALIAGAFAALVGLPLLRLKDHYLALATVGLNVCFEIVAKNWTNLTGGYDGITGIPDFGPWIAGDRSIYGLALGCFLACSAAAIVVRRSALGRAMVAVRDDELAAGACGVDVLRTKVTAFVLAGVFGGLSGALFAHYTAYISPDDFGLPRSIEMLAMLIVGGETSVVGALLGSAFFTFLPDWLRVIGKEAYPTAFGLITLAILIVLPRGVMGAVRSGKSP